MTGSHMTCAHCDELLLGYFENELDESSKAAVESHVGACARCQGLVRDMDAIRESAASLPDIVPSHDLWQGVEARIQPSVVSIARPAGARGMSRSWMAVAAAGLVIVSSSVTYVGTSGSTAREKKPAAVKPAAPVTRAAGATVEAGPPPSVQPSQTPALTAPGARSRRVGRGGLSSRVVQPVSTSSELAIADEIDKLQHMLGERRDQLEPETVKVVEENLAIIDAAVAQARAAVARDPASGFLNERLENALHKKVQLLRTVALLPSST